MKRSLLFGALAVGLTASLAFAQAVIYQDLSGNECWNAGQSPGGPSQFLCTNVVRNRAAKVVTTLTGNMTFGTATLTNLRYGGNILVTTQPVVAPTLTLPPNPVPDGAMAAVCNVSGGVFATTAIALVANSGQTLSTPISVTTLAANTCRRVQFNRATTTWYSIQ
jgi:hypothetical protein